MKTVRSLFCETPQRSLAAKLFAILFVIPAIFIACGDAQKPADNADSASKTDHTAVVPKDSVATNTDTTTEKDAAAATNNTNSSSNAKTSNPDLLHGTVYYSRPYCGGARPTEEVIQNLYSWKKLPNARLLLKANGRQYEIKTDKEGNFTAAIPPGLYDLWLTHDIDKTIYNVEPEGCENCLTEPIAKAKLTAGGTNELYFKFRCDPNGKFRP